MNANYVLKDEYIFLVEGIFIFSLSTIHTSFFNTMDDLDL